MEIKIFYFIHIFFCFSDLDLEEEKKEHEEREFRDQKPKNNYKVVTSLSLSPLICSFFWAFVKLSANLKKQISIMGEHMYFTDSYVDFLTEHNPNNKTYSSK